MYFHLFCVDGEFCNCERSRKYACYITRKIFWSREPMFSSLGPLASALSLSRRLEPMDGCLSKKANEWHLETPFACWLCSQIMAVRPRCITIWFCLGAFFLVLLFIKPWSFFTSTIQTRNGKTASPPQNLDSKRNPKNPQIWINLICGSLGNWYRPWFILFEKFVRHNIVNSKT